MATAASSPSAVVAIAEPVLASAGHLPLAGFLAGYTGLTPRPAAADSPDAPEPP